MKDRHEIRLDLCIAEFDFHPDAITEMTGVQPTRTWFKGERIDPRLPVLHKENGWELSSGISRYEGFEQHTEALLRIIEPNLDNFIKVGNQHYTELSAAVYMYYQIEESIPWLGFNKRAMRVFTQIGAEIDFDMYVPPGE